MAQHESERKPKIFTYKVLTDYFIHADPAADPTIIGANPPVFGLKTGHLDTCWTDFKISIKKLQREAPKGVRYAVCWFGRHGEGWHNVGEATYGREKWDDHWSELDGDGKITWGPDAELTDLGRKQGENARQTWIDELARPDPVPLPTKIFSSPMSRAALTLDITFSGIRTHVENDKGVRPYVIEDLREMIGIHTCDKRRSKSFIQSTYPEFEFEPGFTEEDETWSAESRETDAQMEPRLKRALDKIFGSLLGDDDVFFSITAHSGTIAAALRVIGHREYRLPICGVIPVVIEATVS